jgi:uncharacterized protein YdeI (YjbR/CyaY-like superfamily)
MPQRLTELDVRTRKRWRQWLATHHVSSPGILLVRHKQHTGVDSMPHEELVSKALCFGWVESLIKRLDDDRYAMKITPRKPTSKRWDLKLAASASPPSYSRHRLTQPFARGRT